MDKLLFKEGDNLIKRLIKISGNVHIDNLIPSIWIAQTTEIERILTKQLYDKILNDFTNNTLLGVYEEIYDDYVAPMLVFFTMSDFVYKNSIMVSNGGNFKHSPENSQIPDFNEVKHLSNYYKSMGNNIELKFIDFMKNQTIPEYKSNGGCDGDNEFKFNIVIC